MSRTILVYEYFTGGGFPAGEPPGSLAAEAFGMLWALLADFRRLGRARTATALDPRMTNLFPTLDGRLLPADEVLPASPGRPNRAFRELLKRCDAALILAPETGRILETLTLQAERRSIPVLGSSSAAVRVAGDKAACDRLFRRAGLSAPRSRAVSFAAAPEAAQQMGWPLIVKPIDGAGSEGVCRVGSPGELAEALALVRRSSTRGRILLQAAAAGAHASVSLLVSGGRAVPMSLNRQLIEEGTPFRYHGSEVPFCHPAEALAKDLACRAAGLIPGLRGYVGVDMVLTEGRAQLIEINPRLTTSYIALRQVAPVNLAGAILDACLAGLLPERLPLAGRVVIRKQDPAGWNL